MESNQPNTSSSLFQLNLDASNAYTLRSAASWGKVLAVVGIIMGILFVIAGIMVQSVLSNYSGNSYYQDDLRGNTRMLANAGMVGYLIVGLIMILTSVFLLNFGNKIGRALKANDQASLSGGFAGLRNYLAFWAILMIICLLLMIISVAGMAVR
jgi:hypothetical protein